jgi:hypothetical protein
MEWRRLETGRENIAVFHKKDGSIEIILFCVDMANMPLVVDNAILSVNL